MKQEITLQFPSQTQSTLVLEKGLLFGSRIIEICASLNARIALITDERVDRLWGQKLLQHIQKAKIPVEILTFAGGEFGKTRETKAYLEDRLLERGFGRDTAILALGGGVVTDLAGFVAATYCRGVPFISIPTTLMGMVDASLGGKSAVNTPHGKNMIGAFCQPKFILLDPSLLSGLPEKEMRNGFVEMIKHGLIGDAAHFEYLREMEFLEKAIWDSCQIKLRIVGQDEREGGQRRLLNFGHTVGHAIEKLTHYAIPHGEAVAMGIAVESRISQALGYLPESDLKHILDMFRHKNIPFEIPQGISGERLLEAMAVDKKGLNGVPRFVLLEGIGKPLSFAGSYCAPVDREVLLRCFSNMAHFSN